MNTREHLKQSAHTHTHTRSLTHSQELFCAVVPCRLPSLGHLGVRVCVRRHPLVFRHVAPCGVTGPPPVEPPSVCWAWAGRGDRVPLLLVASMIADGYNFFGEDAPAYRVGWLESRTRHGQRPLFYLQTLACQTNNQWIDTRMVVFVVSGVRVYERARGHRVEGLSEYVCARECVCVCVYVHMVRMCTRVYSIGSKRSANKNTGW